MPTILVYQPLLVTGLGVGVHRTRFKSCSLAFELLPSHPDALLIASARREAAVPIVDRSRSLRAAGVSAPSALLGVHDGGGIEPFLIEPEMLLRTLDGVRRPGITPRSSAFARRLLAAVFESLCDSCSRAEGGLIWKAFGGGISTASAGSSDCERTRGVALSVPHVISCLTASGPNCDGVGEGIDGTRESTFPVGDLGRYGVPAMAASIRLRVGLGGAEIDCEGVSSCSGRRVLPYLIILGGRGFSSAVTDRGFG